MRFSASSHKGLVRETNEDSFKIIPNREGMPFAFVIADGMGGHNSGEVASNMAVDYVENYLINNIEDLTDRESVINVINDIFDGANKEILIKSKEKEEDAGMGTTLIIAIIIEDGVLIGHVGDSRAYHIRDNKIMQITSDHSYIEELIKNGTISREEAETHPKKHMITRAVGCTEETEVDTHLIDLIDNDIIMLCTDGLNKMLNESEIINIISDNTDFENLSYELINGANNKGGGDNITVIAFEK